MLTNAERIDVIQRHPGLRPLWEGLRLEQRQQAIGALLLVVGGGVLSMLFGRESGTIYLLLALLSFVAGAIWLFVLARQQPVEEVKTLLRDEPDAVRWVYVMTTERLPFGLRFSSSTILFLVCTDGREFSVPLPPSKSKLVSKTLNRVLPKADFGYSKEKESLYRGTS